MTQNYQLNASEIMQKCSQALFDQCPPNPNSCSPKQYSHHPIKKDQFKELFTSTPNSSVSPLEESQNNKIIEKLRKKNNKRKQLKEVVIRKTDLGQNQLIFTKQELQKLKQIDEEQLYGITSKPTEIPSPSNNIANSVGNGEHSVKKFFGNPTFDNPREQILSYLDWIDMKQLKKNKEKKKSKILNFQKRQRSPLNGGETLIKMVKNPLPTLIQKQSSPFRYMKNMELNKTKSCYPLAKNNQVEKGFLNSINVNLSEGKIQGEKQKLNEILFKVNQQIEKEYSSCQGTKNFIYMTEDRKQALYECEVLRRVKRQMGQKFYQNLQLSYGNKIKQPESDQDEIDYQKENNDKKEINLNKGIGNKATNKKKIGLFGKQKNYTGQKQKLTFQTEADRMIHKNRNRLKEQRKRVIERIVC